MANLLSCFRMLKVHQESMISASVPPLESPVEPQLVVKPPPDFWKSLDSLPTDLLLDIQTQTLFEKVSSVLPKEGNILETLKQIPIFKNEKQDFFDGHEGKISQKPILVLINLEYNKLLSGFESKYKRNLEKQVKKLVLNKCTKEFNWLETYLSFYHRDNEQTIKGAFATLTELKKKQDQNIKFELTNTFLVYDYRLLQHTVKGEVNLEVSFETVLNPEVTVKLTFPKYMYIETENIIRQMNGIGGVLQEEAKKIQTIYDIFGMNKPSIPNPYMQTLSSYFTTHLITDLKKVYSNEGENANTNIKNKLILSVAKWMFLNEYVKSKECPNARGGKSPFAFLVDCIVKSSSLEHAEDRSSIEEYTFKYNLDTNFSDKNQVIQFVNTLYFEDPISYLKNYLPFTFKSIVPVVKPQEQQTTESSPKPIVIYNMLETFPFINQHYGEMNFLELCRELKNPTNTPKIMYLLSNVVKERNERKLNLLKSNYTQLLNSLYYEYNKPLLREQTAEKERRKHIATLWSELYKNDIIAHYEQRDPVNVLQEKVLPFEANDWQQKFEPALYRKETDKSVLEEARGYTPKPLLGGGSYLNKLVNKYNKLLKEMREPGYKGLKMRKKK